jgi:hypothetical protein
MFRLLAAFDAAGGAEVRALQQEFGWPSDRIGASQAFSASITGPGFIERAPRGHLLMHAQQVMHATWSILELSSGAMATTGHASAHVPQCAAIVHRDEIDTVGVSLACWRPLNHAA